MSADEAGPLRIIAAEVIVTSSSFGIVVDESLLGWAGARKPNVPGLLVLEHRKC
jgi:hypothetical protein